MRKIVSAFLCIALLLSFAACAKTGDAPDQSGADLFVAEPKAGTGRVCYVLLEVAKKAERSLDDAVLAELEKLADEEDLTFYTQETTDVDSYTPFLLTIASGGGSDVVVALGEAMAFPLDQAAAQYPDQLFILVEGGESARPNVTTCDRGTFRQVLSDLL